MPEILTPEQFRKRYGGATTPAKTILTPEQFKARYGNAFDKPESGGIANGLTGKPGRIKSVEDLAAGLNRADVVEADRHDIPPSPAIARLMPKPMAEPEPETVGDPLRRGVQNMFGALGEAALMNPIAERLTPHGLGRMAAELASGVNPLQSLERDTQVAKKLSDNVKAWAEKTIPAKPPTGKYAKPPDKFLDYVDPARIYQVTAENAPLMGAFVASTLANPAAGAALMFGVEGGSAKNAMLDWEKKTGQKINPVYRESIPVIVGAVNAALEKTGLDEILKVGKVAGLKGKLLQAAISTLTEGGTEGAQEITQILAESGYQGKIPEDAGQRFTESLYAGLLLGLGGSGISALAGRAEQEATTAPETPMREPQAGVQPAPAPAASQPVATTAPVSQPAPPAPVATTVPEVEIEDQVRKTASALKAAKAAQSKFTPKVIAAMQSPMDVDNAVMERTLELEEANLPVEGDKIIDALDKRSQELYANNKRPAAAEEEAPAPVEKTPATKDIGGGDVAATPESKNLETAKVFNVPMAEIATDVDRFQNRDTDFSERTAKEVAENFDPNKFDPIVLWRDPENSKTYVLSGHSRFEGMKRRGEANIPARYFQGDERAAINFARLEANRLGASETFGETLKAYRAAKEQQYTAKQMKSTFGSDVDFLNAVQNLNPSGDFVKILSQPAATEFPYIRRFARWIGEARETYGNKFSNAHEEQLFKFLYVDDPKNRGINRDDFFKLLDKNFGKADWDASQPLTLRRGELPVTGTRARSDTKEAMAEIDELRERQKVTKTVEEYQALQAEIEKKLQKVAEVVQSQPDLFADIQEELFEYAQNSGERVRADTRDIVKRIDELRKQRKETTIAADVQKIDAEIDRLNKFKDVIIKTQSDLFADMQEDLFGFAPPAKPEKKKATPKPAQPVKSGDLFAEKPAQPPVVTTQAKTAPVATTPKPEAPSSIEDRAKEALLEIDAESAQSRFNKTSLPREFGDDVIQYLSNNRYILFQADGYKFAGTTVKGREWAGATIEDREKRQARRKAERRDAPKNILQEAARKVVAAKQPKGMTRAQFVEALRALVTKTQIRTGEIDLAIKITDAIAKRWAEWNNSTPEEFYTRNFENVTTDDIIGERELEMGDWRAKLAKEPKRGGVGSVDQLTGLWTIQLFGHSDFSNLIHEIGHVLRRQLPEADQRTIKLWADGKSTNEALSRDGEEKFARAWERYLLEGKAPNSALQEIFAKLKKFLGEIYAVIRKPGLFEVQMNDDVRRVMDNLFGGETIAETQKTQAPKSVMQAAAQRAITSDRSALIEKIVAAARQPISEIRPVVELQMVDGKWYRAGGVPFGAKATGESRIAGYQFVARDGVGVGKLYASEQAARDDYAQRQKSLDDDFRIRLHGMSDERLAEQEKFWIKKPVEKPVANQKPTTEAKQSNPFSRVPPGGWTEADRAPEKYRKPVSGDTEKKPEASKPNILQQAASAAVAQNALAADIAKTKFGGTLPDGRKLVAKDIASQAGAQAFAKGMANREIVAYSSDKGAQRFAVIETTESELKNEASNVASIDRSVEPIGERATTGDQVGAEMVPTGSRRTGKNGQRGVQESTQDLFASSGGELPESPAALGGKRSDSSPYAESPGVERRATGSELGERSGDLGIAGRAVEPVAAAAVERTSTKVLGGSEKLAAQARAENVPVKIGDRANIDETLPILKDGQRDDVAFAETRFAQPTGYGVMFTNGTGTGKTFSGLGIIKRMARSGKDNIIIVVPSDKIAFDWIERGGMLKLNIKKLADTKDNGGRGIVVTTYSNFGQNPSLAKRKWDGIVLDESHYLMQAKQGSSTNALDTLRAISLHPRGAYARTARLHPELFEKLEEFRKRKVAAPQEFYDQLTKAEDATKAEVAAAQGEKRPRVVFLSATPFAYEKAVDYAEGYLFDYPPENTGARYNQASGSDKFMVEHFGYRMRYNKLTEPDKNVDRGLMQRGFNTWLKQQKVLSGRRLDVDADYDRRFILSESRLGHAIDEGLQWLWERKRMQPLWEAVHKKFDHLSRRYLLEAIKAHEVIKQIQANLDAGRKVVVFHDFKKGGAFNPFDIQIADDDPTTVSYHDEAGKQQTVRAKDLVDEFRAARPDLIDLPIGALPSPLVGLKKAFPNAMIFNGDVPKKERIEIVKKFQDDNSGKDVVIVQAAAGREGISLHDTTGKKPRVLFNLGLPTQPTTAIQEEGRIYREGQASDAMFRYLNTGTNWERFAFAETIAQRSSAAENLALGTEARALLDAFIQAYEESGDYPVGYEGEGKGGKQADKLAESTLTDWDRAIALYYANQKKTSRDKSREGTDYFATPEPLGQKMVEWANIRPGDAVLEPSAGHGAIARWFPDLTPKTVIEPSAELASRLKMVTPESRLVQDHFENFNLVNKYDAIVMNPPFGVGGKTAIDHLEKAAMHLKDGGRIVALIPRGGMMDKRFDQWLDGETAQSIYLAANIDLPTITFERAGTKVASRIVVLDKVVDKDIARKLEPSQDRDYTDAETIKEFFDRIENSSIRPRFDAAEIAGESSEESKQPAMSLAEAAATTQEQADYGYPITEHTTATGKQLRGTVRADISYQTAKSIDPYTFKKNGGFYIREKNFKALADYDKKMGMIESGDALLDIQEDESLTDALAKQANPIFYSQLYAALESKLPNSGSVEQIQQAINAFQKKGEFKKDEIEWLGLNEWLAGQKGKITKQQILDFVKENQVEVTEVEKVSDTKFSQYTLPGGENYRELLLTLPTKESKAQFESSHFDEPNILAHVRFNERTDADGKRVLFVEEIQSDWGQAGRKKGYAPRGEIKELPNGWKINQFQNGKWKVTTENGAQVGIAATYEDAKENALAFLNKNKNLAGVSAMPFKTSWHELAFKRMLRYAVDNGFEKVAWTTGEQQAARYPEALQKIVDHIRWQKQDEVTRMRASKNYKTVFDAQMDKDGKITLSNRSEAVGKNISDVVGKEMGQRIMAEPRGEIAGKDFVIGGEGMKGFYDKILSEFVNKYTKKWGGKAGSDEFFEETGGSPYDRARPEKVIPSPYGSGFWLQLSDGEKIGSWVTRQDAEKALKDQQDLFDAGKPKFPVHSLDITPAMRDAVSRGQVLFDIQDDATPAPSGGKFQFSDDIEKRWKASHGIKPISIFSKVADLAEKFRNQATREFEHLPRTAEFSRLRFDLSKLQKQKPIASTKAVQRLQEITDKLTPEDYDIFERLVILNDLAHEAEAGHALPFGFTPATLSAEHRRLLAAAASRPAIADAARQRKAIWDNLKADYVAEMSAIGKNYDGRFSNEDYYRHQVLMYANLKGLVGTGKKLKTPVNRGFLKKREGSSYDINTNYLQAEFEVFSQMLYDIEVAKTIYSVDKNYNVVNELKEQAKEAGEKESEWRQFLPDGYRTWQPQEGNVFYLADSIPARLANDLHTGVLEKLGITKDDLKPILALGGRRKEFVLKNEVADTLDELFKEPKLNVVSKASKLILDKWKAWRLLAPRSAFKYNTRNLIGDADVIFAGNPSAFKKLPQAISELTGHLLRGKAPSAEMERWIERGGMQANLQVTELHEVDKLKEFDKLAEKHGGLTKIPEKVFKGYWNGVRLLTDMRESILRYAAYLDYLEQMKQSGGKPKNFGASIPEEVTALKNVHDKAYKLSNELLGAYDQVSVIGQYIRNHIFPFWSFKEVNFRRYLRLMKNAAQDGRLSEAVGRKLLATVPKSPYIAMRVGAFAIKATALWSVLQVWNKAFFPDEEDDLPEDTKARPHVIFGRDKDGKVIYFDRLGSLGDFLEWFGLDDAPDKVSDFVLGRKTLREIATNMAKAPVNAVVKGIRPEIKLPAELAAGQSSFPDVFKPSVIRDSGLHIARALGVDQEYIAIKKLPSRGYGNSAELMFYYKSDPGETAYYRLYDEKMRFLKKIGKYGEFGGQISAKSNALYNLRLALRYQDKEAVDKYLAEYAALGGDKQGLKTSLKYFHPLNGLGEHEDDFVRQLSADDRDKLKEAIKFYDTVLSEKAQVGELLRQLPDRKRKGKNPIPAPVQ